MNESIHKIIHSVLLVYVHSFRVLGSWLVDEADVIDAGIIVMDRQ